MTTCAVCRRHLLAGEGFRYWQVRLESPGGRVVCLLCEGEAALEGWQRTVQAVSRENAVGLRNTVRRVA